VERLAFVTRGLYVLGMQARTNRHKRPARFTLNLTNEELAGLHSQAATAGIAAGPLVRLLVRYYLRNPDLPLLAVHADSKHNDRHGHATETA
jgi:hypothetical protein